MVLLSGCLEDSMSETRKGLSELLQDIQVSTIRGTNANAALWLNTSTRNELAIKYQFRHCKQFRATTSGHLLFRSRRHAASSYAAKKVASSSSSSTINQDYAPSNRGNDINYVRGMAPTPNSKSSPNPHAPHVKQSTAPALYRTRSVDLLTSFDESDSDAAQIVYRGNQCCVMHQVPAHGNEEEKRNDINPKAWPGIAKNKEKEK
uniref:Uncharacterized protein n=1 Tax=Plectus sambesii TaxID=2011161 RepID=A0A914WZA6_9BILA